MKIIIGLLLAIISTTPLFFNNMFLLERGENSINLKTCLECNPEEDRIKLGELYFHLNGDMWYNNENWNTTLDLDLWHGIETVPFGCVGCINLTYDSTDSPCENNGAPPYNNVSGVLPNPFSFPSIKHLNIRENFLMGVLPDFSCSKNLETIRLNKNQISGPIPYSILNLHALEILWLHQNNLSGQIPIDITDSLTMLTQLILNDNCLSGLVPNFSSNLGLTLNITDNKFTFEDILPFFINNDSLSTFGINDQDSVFVDTCLTTAIGYPLTIDLEIDDTVTSNIYAWFKDGVLIDTTFVNKLVLDTLNLDDGGLYTCRITNSIIPESGSGTVGTFLTLNSHEITVKPCVADTTYINETLCFNDTLHLVFPNQNIDTFFFLESPTGFLFLDDGNFSGTCDSMIIIDLSFHDDTQAFIQDTLCVGDTFSIDLPALDTQITQAGIYDFISSNGSQASPCDSFIHLELFYFDTSILDSAKAEADTLVCIPEVVLNSNLPENTSGQWYSNNSDVFFTYINDTSYLASNLNPGDNVFFWHLSYDMCMQSYDVDSLIVYYQPEIKLIDETFMVTDNEMIDSTLAVYDSLDLILTWNLNVLSDVKHGILDFNMDGSFTYQNDGNYIGRDSFLCLLNIDVCNYFDTAKIVFVTTPELNDIEFPDVITPNGDGYNDTFIIPGIEYGLPEYKPNELIIFNQWGSVICKQESYDNMWAGEGLPEATYYYKFSYGINQIKIGKIVLVR